MRQRVEGFDGCCVGLVVGDQDAGRAGFGAGLVLDIPEEEVKEGLELTAYKSEMVLASHSTR